MTTNMKNPGAGGRRGSSAFAGGEVRGHVSAVALQNCGARIPANWRNRLPDPAVYYGRHVAKLSKPNATGWAQGACPFHEDRTASLSVYVADARGGWRCFAGCGSGNLVAFHMRCTGLAFREAVADLLRGGA